MKFNIYNVTFLFCCLFIFNSCQKKEQEAVNTSSNQSETPASKAESAALKAKVLILIIKNHLKPYQTLAPISE